MANDKYRSYEFSRKKPYAARFYQGTGTPRDKDLSAIWPYDKDKVEVAPPGDELSAAMQEIAARREALDKAIEKMNKVVEKAEAEVEEKHEAVNEMIVEVFTRLKNSARLTDLSSTARRCESAYGDLLLVVRESGEQTVEEPVKVKPQDKLNAILAFVKENHPTLVAEMDKVLTSLEKVEVKVVEAPRLVGFKTFNKESKLFEGLLSAAKDYAQKLMDYVMGFFSGVDKAVEFADSYTDDLEEMISQV